MKNLDKTLIETRPKVALINMPVAATQTPSLGLSLLKAGLTDLGIATDVHYLNIKYAEMVGLDVLKEMEWVPTAQLVGDWLFSGALWGNDKQRDAKYIEEILQDKSEEHIFHENRAASESLISDVLACKEQIEEFLERCLNEVPWEQYTIIGFTSLFQQHVAALAMAKRLKQRYPNLIIAFGGANCVDEMGEAIMDNFDFVDVVCTGMGENSFFGFTSDILEGRAPATHSDLIIRQNIACLPQPNTAIQAMDDLPYPDFDDFFRQRKDSNLPSESLSMLVETSRGCWWGQKQHCTFCGLNADTMAFKFKSSKRAFDEFTHLVSRYGHHTKTIAVVDNIIPMDYLKGFLIELRDSELQLDIFYETKANLKKEHLELYKQAGLNVIQPGVESFSNRLLTEMRKGITGLQNIQFLKWCREFGLKPMWNYMVGFPNENKEDHLHQIELMKSLSHLSPPDIAWVRIDRFSPYYNDSNRFGISNLRPFGSFKYLYPELNEKQRARIAYFFLGDFEAKDKMVDYAFDVRETVENWNSEHSHSALFHFELNGQLIVGDYRPNSSQNIHRLTKTQKTLYDACDKIRGEMYLFKLIGISGTREEMREQLNDILEPLLSCNLIICDEGKYLSLAVSIDNHFFPPESLWASISELFETENAALV